jgi:MFS family permease
MPQGAWVLFAGTFINRFGSFVVPFLVLYLTSRGYSVAETGGVVATYGAGGFVASLGGGVLADRFGRRNAVVISMFSSAAAMLALGSAGSLALIVPLTFVAAACTEAYRPASSALLADLVQPEARVTAYAMYRFAINLGFAIGPAVAGLLATHSFFLLFAGDAVSSCLFGLNDPGHISGLHALYRAALRFGAGDRSG